jgi:hypothetical protein
MVTLMLALASAWLSGVATAPNVPLAPTADQIAGARAEGDALLRNAHAEALFVNETGSGAKPTAAILLRHRASGFLCMFDPGKPQNQVSVFRSLTVGADVGCTTRGPTATQNLYIFRAPEKSLSALLDDAEREVKVGDPGAEVVTPPPRDPLAGLPAFVKVPDHVSASLSSAKGGYRIVIGKLGDWAVETRFNGGPLVAASPALDPIWLMTVAEGQRHGPVSETAQAAPATPEALHAQGDDLVARSHAPDIFENVTSEKVISVRHKPSGFVCTFDPDQSENAVQLYSAARPRGEDIGCTSRTAGMVVSYFVTKFPVAVTPQQAAQAYMREIKQMHPDVADAKGPFLQLNITTKPGDPPPVSHVTAHLTYVDHGEVAYSRLCVAVVNGWVIEQRITAPLAQQQAADLLGELAMLSATKTMSEQPAMSGVPQSGGAPTGAKSTAPPAPAPKPGA